LFCGKLEEALVPDEATGWLGEKYAMVVDDDGGVPGKGAAGKFGI
jgi:hypothetical protein